MKFVYIILIFSSLASAKLEILSLTDDETSDNINDLIDSVIPQISQFIVNNNLDPLNLPQIDTRLWSAYSNEVEPMIYKAHLTLHSGILRHLSNLKRFGDATCNSTDKLVKLDIGFEFTFLQGTYNYTVNLVFFNLKGRVLISAASVRCKIIITLDTENYTLSLDKFKLQVPGNIKVIVENKNGGVDWLNTIIVNIIIPFFKDTIINAVEEKAASAIQTYLDNLSILDKNKLITPIFENYKYRINIT